MRWVSTEVLPVPAPATTSIGPWRCSMAVRWRSSGTNNTGRVFGFEGGIQGQNTTARHEEGCGGNGQEFGSDSVGGERARCHRLRPPALSSTSKTLSALLSGSTK